MLESTAKPLSKFLNLYQKTDFSLIDGWRDDDHAAAFACFRVSARKILGQIYKQGRFGPPTSDLAKVAGISLGAAFDGRITDTAARHFFEQEFVPYRFGKTTGNNKNPVNDAISPEGRFRGFVTGYFEPEIDASPSKTAKFSFPLYARPADLVELDEETRPVNWDKSIQFARKTESGYQPYHDRAEIDQGALAGKGLEIAWLENPVDAFFIHIQGSARLRFTDGKTRRLSYAGKNGHPYTAIGSVLVRNRIMSKEQLTMDTLRDWMEQDLERATKLMRQNRSFIFFTIQDDVDPSLGPVGAASVPLTPGRSLAIDHTLFTYGMPVWLTTELALPQQAGPFRRLMVAQDTGSAIKGPARGDIFVGSGREAGMVAGSIRHACEFFVLLPVKSVKPVTP